MTMTKAMVGGDDDTEYKDDDDDIILARLHLSSPTTTATTTTTTPILTQHAMAAESRSGNLIGHAIPAFFFAVIGIGWLLLMLVRSRWNLSASNNKNNSNNNTSYYYCESHVPERNSIVLYVFGSFVLVGTLTGMLYEAQFLPEMIGHEALYFSWTLPGLVFMMEGKRSVPPDTGRAMCSISLILCYIMFQAHGKMKSGLVDKEVHALLANLHLANASAFGYSVKFPSSTIGFVTAWGLLLATAVWMVTIGLWEESYFEMSIHEVHPIFSFEIVLVAFVIIGVGAAFGISSSRKEEVGISAPNTGDEEEYCPLRQDMDCEAEVE